LRELRDEISTLTKTNQLLTRQYREEVEKNAQLEEKLAENASSIEDLRSHLASARHELEIET
jgi:predicted RNase H-like nuclease (RuvC/YqgF family)